MWLLPLISPLPPEGMESKPGPGNCTPRAGTGKRGNFFRLGWGKGLWFKYEEAFGAKPAADCGTFLILWATHEWPFCLPPPACSGGLPPCPSPPHTLIDNIHVLNRINSPSSAWVVSLPWPTLPGFPLSSPAPCSPPAPSGAPCGPCVEFSRLIVGQLVMGAGLKSRLSGSVLGKNRRASAPQLSLW